MTLPTNLTDLELVLLATAAQRDDNNVLPLAASIAGEMERVREIVPRLIDQKLIEEVEVRAVEAAWRTADDRRYGLAITSTGRISIGVQDKADNEDSASPSAATGPVGVTAEPAADPTSRTTKAAQVLELLRRDDGATLDELIAATKWLPHTTRAALTGLRKKGHAIERSKRGEATCYRVTANA